MFNGTVTDTLQRRKAEQGEEDRVGSALLVLKVILTSECAPTHTHTHTLIYVGSGNSSCFTSCLQTG